MIRIPWFMSPFSKTSQKRILKFENLEHEIPESKPKAKTQMIKIRNVSDLYLKTKTFLAGQIIVFINPGKSNNFYTICGRRNAVKKV